METKAIIAYVICDDTIKDLKIKQDIQSRMNDAEVMVTGIIGAIEYSGNLEKASRSLKAGGYIPNMLSRSQLNRRLHKIENDVWNSVLSRLHLEFALVDYSNEFIVDSCPVYSCKLARQNQTKLYSNKEYLGFCAAKDEWFIGYKLHMITDINGVPLIFLPLPAAGNDMASFKKIDLSLLPKQSRMYGDKAYNDYGYEDYLIHKREIYLIPIRKKNSKRKGSKFLEKIRQSKRKIIETAFICIEKLMPRSIHAVTKKRFSFENHAFCTCLCF